MVCVCVCVCVYVCVCVCVNLLSLRWMTPDGQSQHWVPGPCCSSPVQKNRYRIVMSSHLHRNSPKQTFKTELTY